MREKMGVLYFHSFIGSNFFLLPAQKRVQLSNCTSFRQFTKSAKVVQLMTKYHYICSLIPPLCVFKSITGTIHGPKNPVILSAIPGTNRIGNPFYVYSKS